MNNVSVGTKLVLQNGNFTGEVEKILTYESQMNKMISVGLFIMKCKHHAKGDYVNVCVKLQIKQMECLLQALHICV